MTPFLIESWKWAPLGVSVGYRDGRVHGLERMVCRSKLKNKTCAVSENRMERNFFASIWTRRVACAAFEIKFGRTSSLSFRLLRGGAEQDRKSVV